MCIYVNFYVWTYQSNGYDAWRPPGVFLNLSFSTFFCCCCCLNVYLFGEEKRNHEFQGLSSGCQALRRAPLLMSHLAGSSSYILTRSLTEPNSARLPETELQPCLLGMGFNALCLPSQPYQPIPLPTLIRSVSTPLNISS